jgi:hypothetical protein
MRPAVEKRQGTKSRREVVRERCRGLYGDLATGRRLATGIRLGQEDNLDVTARILLMVKFTFYPTRDFNELRVPKMNTLQLLRDEPHNKLWATA